MPSIYEEYPASGTRKVKGKEIEIFQSINLVLQYNEIICLITHQEQLSEKKKQFWLNS